MSLQTSNFSHVLLAVIPTALEVIAFFVIDRLVQARLTRAGRAAFLTGLALVFACPAVTIVTIGKAPVDAFTQGGTAASEIATGVPMVVHIALVLAVIGCMLMALAMCMKPPRTSTVVEQAEAIARSKRGH